MKVVPQSFFDRDPIEVARDLLGKYLVHNVGGSERVGKIVEVEAYLGPHDLAAHSSKGLTPRTRVLFGPPGHAYIYLIYGMYFCMNATTGNGSGILLRALEPVKNVDERTQGPGLLCKAMRIDKRLYGCDLTSLDFYIAEADSPAPSIVARPRIGVAYAKHWAKRKLRFYIRGNPYVSQP